MFVSSHVDYYCRIMGYEFGARSVKNASTLFVGVTLPVEEKKSTMIVLARSVAPVGIMGDLDLAAEIWRQPSWPSKGTHFVS